MDDGNEAQGKDKTLPIDIRWLTRNDIPQVLNIEGAKLDYAPVWTLDDFNNIWARRTQIAMVAEHNRQVVGVMVYELENNRLRIVNFAVHPDFRRQGVGTQMAKRLVDKATFQKRAELLIEVDETNLVAQQFFRARGFKAIGVLKEHFDETGRDAYVMRYSANRNVGDHQDRTWHRARFTDEDFEPRER